MSILKNVTIGQYYPGDSFIHKLDPRLKLLAVLTLIVALFFINTFWGYLPMLVLLLTTIRIAKLPIKMVLKGLKPLWFLIIFTLLLHVLFTSGGDVLISIWIITIESNGVYQGFFMGTRLALLVVNTSILTLTTSPIALTDALESLLSPFKKNWSTCS